MLIYMILVRIAFEVVNLTLQVEDWKALVE